MANREDIIEDTQKRLDNLINFSSRRREWYQEQHLRVVDRQSTQISLISSVSATILAITAALPPQIYVGPISLSFVFLLFSTVGGVALILWSTNFDERDLKESRDEELSLLEKLKSSTRDALKKPSTASYLKHVNDFNEQKNKIVNLPEKHGGEKKLLNYLYLMVLIAFTSGVLCLALGWFTGRAIKSKSLFDHKTERHLYKTHD